MTTSGWLIIFDCDGVLVDTETIANREMARWITDAGFPITYEQCRKRFIGRSIPSVREVILAEDGFDIGADFPGRWREALPEIFAHGVKAVAGIEDAIAQLQAEGHAICVASSGTIDKMHMTLGCSGLLDDLKDVLFSSTMVAHGKPAPDLFLHAASEIGFSPERCIVIEDSPLGAQAARDAGMACFGYVGDPMTNADRLTEHGAILFDAMDGLQASIARHINQAS